MMFYASQININNVYCNYNHLVQNYIFNSTTLNNWTEINDLETFQWSLKNKKGHISHYKRDPDRLKRVFIDAKFTVQFLKITENKRILELI